MFWSTAQTVARDRLLEEVASTGAMPDPYLVVYATLALTALLALAVAYLAFGRGPRDARAGSSLRPKSARRAHQAQNAR